MTVVARDVEPPQPSAWNRMAERCAAESAAIDGICKSGPDSDRQRLDAFCRTLTSPPAPKRRRLRA